ncbi:MAG: ABC transporter permease [Muribaculaceae bacterium]|nr:ABC transporter permease [Muribaculaceae bacterium]
MFDLLHEIGQTLRNNKLRTILTGISVAWGIFMLIILLGAARGVANSFDKQSSSEAHNVISIWGGRTTKAYKGYRDGRWIGLRNGDGDALKEDHPHLVSYVAAEASVDNATVASDREVISGGLTAVSPTAILNKKIPITHGRFINELDMQHGRRVMVLSESHAEQLFGNADDAIGRTVRSMGLGWTVVGVYSNPYARSKYIPYSTYKRITGNDDRAYQLDVFVEGLTTEADGEEAERNIRGTLARTHSFAPDDKGALWTWNRFTSYLANSKASGMLAVVVWVIGILTLLTGIVGVSNIMFVSVRERVHEIGIRRAIGAKPRNILFQIITESVALTSIFGYIGIFMGMVVLQVINAVVGEADGFVNGTVDLSIAIQVTLALIVAGALAGLFPALKAIKVKPVEALRDE